jgi:hypothetical protein
MNSNEYLKQEAKEFLTMKKWIKKIKSSDIQFNSKLLKQADETMLPLDYIIAMKVIPDG